jgi:uncharacterized membrane protein
MRSKAALLLAATCALLPTTFVEVPAALAGGGPQVVSATIINGNQKSYMPGVGIAANLDGTPLVAGLTRYDPDGRGPHLIFNDTLAGYLWQGRPPGSQSPGPGSMQIFYLHPQSLYYTPSRYVPAAIASNQTVVGSVAFTETFTTAPWEWTPANGLTFLPLPGSSWQGSAAGVSSDGSVVAGSVFQRVGFSTTSSAAQWANGSLSVLGSAGSWSQAHAISGDGSVVVGEQGASSASAQAARWVNGQQVPVNPLGNSSTALFTSADGQTAVGTAALSPAMTELVRWDASGTAQELVPPAGYSVDRVMAINPDATAVVGSVVSYPDCTPGGPGPVCNGVQAPFLWTSTSGFTVLPVDGLPDYYDSSVAVGISDDGTKVVGDLIPSVQSPGSPPPEAFVWSPGTGEILLDTLTTAAGYNYQLSGATAISSSGDRILATGAVNPPTVHDASAVILGISGLG